MIRRPPRSTRSEFYSPTIPRFFKMWGDSLLIVFISICTALLGEGVTWALVYRTEKYQRLKAEIERQSKKLEKIKENHSEALDRQQKKKIEREEEKLKNNSRYLSLVKMKSMLAIGFAFTALLSMFNSIFDGRVVAKLPFVPIVWIQGLSHRNLPGDDYTDCSFIFLYILCTMSIRQNVQKMLGFAPSRAASKQSGSLFGPQPQSLK
uniref:Calcium load-activated calcium channel n=1 Tax=Lynceus sp. MCZ IZ 141354 TaxID=1930659 RepID=A0A9N6ZFS1_9CRUS|nr:EOG090X0DWG [Lynceus sp. MCZ IZ 141354]